MGFDPRMSRRISYVNLPAQFEEERAEIMSAIESIFLKGDFIGGEAVEKFEQSLCDYIGVKHAIALNSGTDALIFSMSALGIGPGDEVITPPNSFVASTSSIISVGATPVFCDVKEDQNIDPEAILSVITPRTRAIMPVHLTGRMANMPEIMGIARKHNLAVIEDCAQSIGSRYENKLSGTYGSVGCFSCHPLKNLNAAGDAGFVVTNDASIAEKIKNFRNHGLINRNDVLAWGTVSRLDTIQAKILEIRLKSLASVTERRRRNAELYRSYISKDLIFMPACRTEEFNTFHTFVVQVNERNKLREYLLSNGIETAIHYPIPIHLQPAAGSLGYKKGDFPVTESQAEKILTLPVNQSLAIEDIEYVSHHINGFYQ